MTQDEIFFQYEGDHWLDRNEEQLDPDRNDVVVNAVLECGIKPTSIIEVGCSNGYRLEKLRRMFHAQCVGIDASRKAVEHGLSAFPDLCLRQYGLADFREDTKYDLVVCNFVLHWIDRERLMDAVSNIDRVVCGGGTLVLGDFMPDFNPMSLT